MDEKSASWRVMKKGSWAFDQSGGAQLRFGPRNVLLLGAAIGAIAFSGKAIIVKLAYRYGVDAVTLVMYRMLFALPVFALMAWWAGRGRSVGSSSKGGNPASWAFQ